MSTNDDCINRQKQLLILIFYYTHIVTIFVAAK